jgi:opacity protein-like surface antigen
LISDAETRNKWDADLALRFGWAFDRLFVYSKAGVAWGGFNFSQNFSSSQTCTNPALCVFISSTIVSSASRTLTGMVLGFGTELAVADHWIARLEGDYINYGRTDVSFTGTGTFTCPACTPSSSASVFTNTVSQFASKWLVKAALSYKF